MPKIFVASFNRASDGAVSKLIDKLNDAGMLAKAEDADYLLACGDRKETFEYCLEMFQENVPIIHLWAGEVSQGTHDEVYRWAITNMSMMQLCTNETSQKRVWDYCDAIGKETNAYVIGNVMLDNLEVDEENLPKVPYDLVLYNPPTKENAELVKKELDQILELLGDNDYLWGQANGDNYSELVNEYSNLGYIPRPEFLGLLKNCERFITNSSCADYEARFLLRKRAIIRIGERNKNRESRYSDMTIPNASENIINILKTLDKKEWVHPEYEHMVPNKYGWCVAYPENFVLGENTDIGYGTYINAAYGVVIDDGARVGGGCMIYSDNSINQTHGEVHIGRNATVGANSVILPNVHIGENAHIPAGAIVVEDVPSHSSLLRAV